MPRERYTRTGGPITVSVEINAPPPVPPRRRKRRTDVIVPSKPIVAARTIVRGEKTPAVRNGVSRPIRKPRSRPVPPPVPESVVPSERKLRSAGKSHLASATSDNSRLSFKANSDEVLPKPRLIITDNEEKTIHPEFDVDRDSRDDLVNVNLSGRSGNRSGRSSPIPPGNSSLFFTFRDFESVMAHSAKCDRSLSEQFVTITTPERSMPVLIKSLLEDTTSEGLDNDRGNEEEVCFRVTTTNVPFEKCLGDGNLNYVSNDFDSQFDDSENHYVFEDYIDRRKASGGRLAAALFDDVNINRFEPEEPIGRRSATKVRFASESPPTFISESVFINTCERVDRLEPPNDDYKPFVTTTESPEKSRDMDDCEALPVSMNSDDFDDLPFYSLTENELTADSHIDSPENYRSEQASNLNDIASGDALKNACESREVKNFETFSRPRSTPSPRFMSPSRPRFDPVPNIDDIAMPEFPPTYDPRDEGFVKKQWDAQANPAASEITNNTREDDKNTGETFLALKLGMTSPDDRDSKFPIAIGSSGVAASNGNSRDEKLEDALENMPCQGFRDDDADVVDWEDSSENEDPRANHIPSQYSNFYDFEETIHGSVNLDMYQGQELDKHWTRSRVTTFEEDECDKGVLLEEQEVKRSSVLPEEQELRRSSVLVEEQELKRSSVLAEEQELRGSSVLVEEQELERRSPILVEEQELKKSSLLTEEKEIERSSPSFYQGKLSRLSIDSKDDGTLVSVFERRNSFLENMLVHDEICSADTTVPCSIIAAHPKPTPSPTQLIYSISGNTLIEMRAIPSSPIKDIEGKSHVRLEVIEAKETNEKSEKESGRRAVGPEPKVAEMTSSRGPPIERPKSTGEAKDDVLTELLCNFSALKLKSVQPRERGLVLDQIDDGGTITMETVDEGSAGTTKAVERIKIENTLGIETIRGEIKIKDTSVNRTASKLSQHEASAMTKAKTGKNGKIYDSKRSPSPNIDVGAKTDGGNDRRVSDDKSAIVVIECMEDRDASRSLATIDGRRNSDTRREAMTLDNRETIVNADECAIVRNTINPLNRRNNNDNNNAMTPLDLSNDQKSRDDEVSTITPGSVRSFVELYEIQHEKTSEHSKSNYSLPVARTRTKLRCFKGSWNNDDYYNAETRQDHYKHTTVETKFTGNQETSVSNIHTRVTPSKTNQVPSMTMDRSDFEKNQSLRGRESTYEVPSNGRNPIAAKRRAQESCLKINNDLSPRNESKKTVTFYSDCHVHQPRDNPPREIPLRESKIGDAEGKPKTAERRAPGRPTSASAVTEELDCVARSIVDAGRESNVAVPKISRQDGEANPPPLPRSAVNSFTSEIHQAEIDGVVEDCTIKPGIASLRPNSDVPQLRQPYVFYCRV